MRRIKCGERDSADREGSASRETVVANIAETRDAPAPLPRARWPTTTARPSTVWPKAPPWLDDPTVQLPMPGNTRRWRHGRQVTQKLSLVARLEDHPHRDGRHLRDGANASSRGGDDDRCSWWQHGHAEDLHVQSAPQPPFPSANAQRSMLGWSALRGSAEERQFDTSRLTQGHTKRRNASHSYYDWQV